LTSYPYHDFHLFSLPRRPLRLNLRAVRCGDLDRNAGARYGGRV